MNAPKKFEFVNVPGMTRPIPNWMAHLYFRDHHTRFVSEREMRDMEKETIMATMMISKPRVFTGFHEIGSRVEFGLDDNTMRRRLKELAREGHLIEKKVERGWFVYYLYAMPELPPF